MKTSLGVLWILLSPLLAAAENFEISKTAVVDGYFVALAKDCSTLFFAPGSYRVDKSKSLALFTYQVTEHGAQDVVIPKIQMNLHLVPEVPGLGLLSDPQSNVDQWIANVAPECDPTKIQRLPYPEILRTLGGATTPSKVFRFVEAQFGEGDSVDAKFEALALEVDAESLLTRLQMNTLLNSVVTTYAVQPEVSAKLTVAYDAMTSFVENHYTEQVCYSRERCLFGAFGIKLGCHTENHCDDIPKVVQVIKDMAYKSQAVLDVYSAPGVPEYRLQKAQEDLLSSFLMSNFLITSEVAMQDMTKVTLGEFKKVYKDSYSEQVSYDHVVENKFRLDLQISSLKDVFSDDLAKIFNSQVLLCLKAYAKSAKPIRTSNACFN